MLKKIAKKCLTSLGYQITPLLGADMELDFKPLYDQCKQLTSTTPERMYALYKSIKYVVEHEIPGDIVECGVWRGGSCMLCALTLKNSGDITRKIYMYDTYRGMPKPGHLDVNYRGQKAMTEWQTHQLTSHNSWTFAPLQEVKKNMVSTGYPGYNIVFVEGMVEETIPTVVPEKISLLRLDTDWYESTYHELTHLFPRLSAKGIIIIDDYGYWKGSQEAVDKYFSENNVKIFLNRVDRSARLGVKLEP